MQRYRGFIILAVAIAAAHCAGRNLITNGSFDQDTTSWYRNHASTAGAIALEPREEHGACVRLQSDGESVDLAQNIELAGGQTCVFQMDLKRTAAGPDIRGFLVVRRKNGRDDYHSLGTDQTTLNQWEHVAKVIRPASDLVSARVLLLNRLEHATAWFDNVQVTPLETHAQPGAGFAPTLAISALDNPPTIDGAIDADEWAGAATIEALGLLADGTRPDAATTAWIGHDNARLLIAVYCEEPNMDAARFEARGHDVGSIFADDTIELFIDPDNDHQSYYHFALSGGGADYDASHGAGPVSGVQYESGWTARTHRGPDYWSIEAAIPFASLIAGSTGRIWGLNLCRQRQAGARRELSGWAATGTSFHAPARFGDIVFPEPPAPPTVTAALEGVEASSPGPAHVRASVKNQAEKTQVVVLAASISGPDGTLRRSAAPLTLDAGETRQVSLPFTIDSRGRWQVVLSCSDAETDVELFAGGAAAFIVPPVLQARVATPWYRGRIFSKMDLQRIEVEATVALRTAERRGTRLQAMLTGNDREQTSSIEPVNEVSILSLPCRTLPLGTYDITVHLLNGDGDELARVDGMTVEKLPPAADELWFDRNNNLWINGQQHVPTGFFSLDSRARIPDAAVGGYTLYHTYASQSISQLDPETTRWDWPKWFDAGAQANMRAFVGIGYRGDGEKDEDGKRIDFLPRLLAGQKPEAEKRMRGFIERWKQHPGLAAWYLYDEPSLAGRTVDEIRYLFNLADGIDPYHPKAICQVFWTDPRFVPWMDVLMPDPYPIRASNSRPLRSVANAVRAARRTVNDEKPVWPVLQWYKYKGGRFPTPTEMRCMAFLSIAAGAKGMTWYSFYYGYRDDRAHWPDILRIGRELRACEDIVLAPYAQNAVHIEPAEAPLEVMTKQSAGRLHIVLVNYENQPLSDIKIRVGNAAVNAAERLSGTEKTITRGMLNLDFAAYEPLVIDVALDE